jgi:riboflavin synthase alpha subunit
MFTGIVLERGRVERVSRGSGAVRLELRAPRAAPDAATGDSIALDGCCLTVAAREGDRLSFDAVPETLLRTTLGELEAGAEVNVEPALRVGDRMGGHWVQGHVDGVGTVARVLADGDSVEAVVEAPADVLRYAVVKGSICMSGVSLTIVSLDERTFSVALVPHTLEVTTLARLEPGTRVNLEADVLAKYLERLVSEGLWYDRRPAR